MRLFAVICIATGQPVSWIDQSIFTVLEPIAWRCHRDARCYGNTSCSVLLPAIGGLQRASAQFLSVIWRSLTCAAAKAKIGLFLQKNIVEMEREREIQCRNSSEQKEAISLHFLQNSLSVSIA